ncbi:MAG: hypothetical protein WC375_10550 [Methanomassiliicoccales archaeon]|jgi:hypothetical protein
MKFKLSKASWIRMGKQARWINKCAGQYRGNQYRETPQEAFMKMIRDKSPNAILMNEDGMLELWTQDDKASGYILEINGIGYRFVKKLTEDEFKQYDIYSMSGKDWTNPKFGTHIEEAILKSMARTFYVAAWADHEEEEGRSYPGQELFSVAPQKTPQSAINKARETIESLEMQNHMSINELFEKAVKADMKSNGEDNPDVLQHVMGNLADQFGYGMAMRSLGHGVGWEDDHADIGIKYPYVEYYWEGDA